MCFRGWRRRRLGLREERHRERKEGRFSRMGREGTNLCRRFRFRWVGRRTEEVEEKVGRVGRRKVGRSKSIVSFVVDSEP